MRTDCFPVFTKQLKQMFPTNPRTKFELRDKMTREERSDFDRMMKLQLSKNENEPRVTYRQIYSGPVPFFLASRGIENE